MRFLSVCLLFFLLPLCSFCELRKTKKLVKYTVPVATIKIKPLNLADPMRASLFFSSDLRLYKNLSAEIGAGWFFAGYALYKYKHENLNGTRVRLGLKYHIFSAKFAAPYIGVEAKYNYIVSNRYRDVSRAGFQYQQIYLTNRVRHTSGAAVKAGVQFYAGRENGFTAEAYIGPGYRFSKIQDQLPEDAEIIERRRWLNPFYELESGTYHQFDFILGVSVGYYFNRKRIVSSEFEGDKN